MSNTKREPLLSDEELDRICEFHPYHAQLYAKRSAMAVNGLHEDARAKDAELIQQLVDEVSEWMQPNLDERFRGEQWHESKRILDAAEAAGFKPTDQ
jgi:hypothetical protein